MNWLPLLVMLWATPADAQNTTCATRAAGDNTNACATTAFVTTAIAAIPSSTLNANSILGNATAGSATGTSLAMPSCSTSASALLYTTNTGFSCNSAINAAQLGGATFAAPGSIGSGTPAAGAFTTLSASSTVSGAGFSAYLASPPAIGGTVAAAGNFTTLGLSNTVTLAAGTTSISPLTFQTGTNLTTPAAGAREYDGDVFYATPNASNRGVDPAEHFVVLSSANTLTSQTAVQPLFDGGGGPANGAITLPTGTFFFECQFALSSMSGSAGAFGFALGGTATKTEAWTSLAVKNTSLTGFANNGYMTFNTTANTALVDTTTTATTGIATISGVIRVTVTGTIIPQVSLGVAAAASVSTNSYFRIRKIGSSSVVNVGNWN